MRCVHILTLAVLCVVTDVRMTCGERAVQKRWWQEVADVVPTCDYVVSMRRESADCICGPIRNCQKDSKLLCNNRYKPCLKKSDVCCPRECFSEAAVRTHANMDIYARPNEFPWVVAILTKEAGATWSSTESVGVGSLIHRGVVLTAAHKVDTRTASEIKCRAGELDRLSTAEPQPHHERDVREIVIHQGYKRLSLFNSIALLFLAGQFEPRAHVQAACLGGAPPAPGARCFGTGWGRLSYDPDADYSRYLKKLPLTLVGRAQCERSLQRVHKSRASFRLLRGFTCARAARDTCTGDGGAPLLCPVPGAPGRYAVVGLTAWGVGCGDVPGVYVDVVLNRNWIEGVCNIRGIYIQQ